VVEVDNAGIASALHKSESVHASPAAPLAPDTENAIVLRSGSPVSCGLPEEEERESDLLTRYTSVEDRGVSRRNDMTAGNTTMRDQDMRLSGHSVVIGDIALRLRRRGKGSVSSSTPIHLFDVEGIDRLS